MVRVRFQPGLVMRIPLEDGMHTYGRMLQASPYVAFHDFRTTDEEPDLSKVVASPVLFVLASGAVRSLENGEWKSVGKVLLSEVDTPIPLQFMQNIGNINDMSVMDHLGNRRAATFEECENLERASVWQAEHVEERLNDHYAGRENQEVRRGRIKKP